MLSLGLEKMSRGGRWCSSFGSGGWAVIRITMMVHVVDFAGAAVGENLVKGLCCSPLASI